MELPQQVRSQMEFGNEGTFFRGAVKFLSYRGYAGYAGLTPSEEICDNARMKSQTAPKSNRPSKKKDEVDRRDPVLF
jgi:hypothetical protein